VWRSAAPSQTCWLLPAVALDQRGQWCPASSELVQIQKGPLAAKCHHQELSWVAEPKLFLFQSLSLHSCRNLTFHSRYWFQTFPRWPLGLQSSSPTVFRQSSRPS
jgi:hypothetical protein